MSEDDALHVSNDDRRARFAKMLIDGYLRYQVNNGRVSLASFAEDTIGITRQAWSMYVRRAVVLHRPDRRAADRR